MLSKHASIIIGRLHSFGFPGLRHNPFGVDWFLGGVTQGSSFLATLGFERESLWDSQPPIQQSGDV
jgi:hypothetical protein